MAETRKEANAAFDLFVETYGVKYEKAVAKLVKDRSELLAFYDFPAEHWKHIRTTNPIESVFATVRNRTRKTKGCLNRKTALAMVYRLMILLGTLLRNTLSDNGQPRKSGGRSPDQTVYPKSFRGLNSRTASSKFKSPPDEGRHQLLGISPCCTRHPIGPLVWRTRQATGRARSRIRTDNIKTSCPSLSLL